MRHNKELPRHLIFLTTRASVGMKRALLSIGRSEHELNEARGLPDRIELCDRTNKRG